ncbi:MAG: aminopeptidase P N-terminal domain-containing protein [Longimicrobiales bacterium]
MNEELLERCRSRRERVLALLPDAAAMILPAAPELRIGRDLELRYQPDPELYYLTGCTEPEAVALLLPGNDEHRVTLFVRARNADAELWTGARDGPDAARERFGADIAYPTAELAERLPQLLAGVDTLYYRLRAGRPRLDDIILGLLAAQRRARQRRGVGARALVDPGAILDELRLIKDEYEIRSLRQAAHITVEGFREAATLIRAGVGEWEIEAALEAAFRRRAADGPAFPSIVASGSNATVLHYVQNSRAARAGELILIDAGARLRMYAGDLSRTLPVSGRFTAAQREMYDIVLAAHDAGIAAVAPGATEADIHQATIAELVRGMVRIGLLQGEPQALLEDDEQPWKPYFPHRASHWLGLDVHDVGDYTAGDDPRRLEPGMVLTIEPGLYIPPPAELPDHIQRLRGTGIRIEDAVLVTPDGRDVLSADLPVAADDIAALVGRR